MRSDTRERCLIGKSELRQAQRQILKGVGENQCTQRAHSEVKEELKTHN